MKRKQRASLSLSLTHTDTHTHLKGHAATVARSLTSSPFCGVSVETQTHSTSPSRWPSRETKPGEKASIFSSRPSPSWVCVCVCVCVWEVTSSSSWEWAVSVCVCVCVWLSVYV